MAVLAAEARGRGDEVVDHAPIAVGVGAGDEGELDVAEGVGAGADHGALEGRQRRLDAHELLRVEVGHIKDAGARSLVRAEAQGPERLAARRATEHLDRAAAERP